LLCHSISVTKHDLPADKNKVMAFAEVSPTPILPSLMASAEVSLTPLLPALPELIMPPFPSRREMTSVLHKLELALTPPGTVV